MANQLRQVVEAHYRQPRLMVLFVEHDRDVLAGVGDRLRERRRRDAATRRV
jgi:hypothetical protein